MKMVVFCSETENQKKVFEILVRDFGESVFFAKTAQKAIDFIKESKDEIGLILTDLGSHGEAFLDYLKLTQSEVPLYILLQQEMIPERYYSLKGLTAISEFEDFYQQGVFAIQKFYDFPLKKENNFIEELKNYVEIPIENLIGFLPFTKDIYFEIGKKKFFYKINKKNLNENQIEAIETLKSERKIDEFWVRKKDLLEFLDERTMEIQEIWLQEDPNDELLIRFALHAQLLRNIASQLTYQDELKAWVQALTTWMKTIVLYQSKVPNFEKLKEKFGPLYFEIRPLFVSVLSIGLLKNLEWSSDVAIQKLLEASLLHDVFLPSRKLAILNSVHEFNTNKNEWTEEDKKIFLHHSENASEWILENHEFHLNGVSEIIREHHEKPDGSGFPKSLHHSQISPLSSIFIVVLDLFDQSCFSEKWNFNQYLQEASERFQDGKFHQIFEALKDLNFFASQRN